MKRALAVALLLIVAAGVASAQQEKAGGETKLVIQQEPPKHENYYTIRFGAWFPKDKEKEFTFDGDLIDATKGDIEQSQALGLDFHFRRAVGKPMYTDISVGAWYTKYNFDFFETLSSASEIEKADAYAIIIPVTVGLSVAPLT